MVKEDLAGNKELRYVSVYDVHDFDRITRIVFGHFVSQLDFLYTL